MKPDANKQISVKKNTVTPGRTSIFDIPNAENLDIKKTYDFVRETERIEDFEKNHPDKIQEIWDFWKNLKFKDFKK